MSNEHIQDMCKSDNEALDLLDQVTRGKVGGDRKSEEYKTNDNNIINDRRVSPVGTSKEKGLRELRDKRPDLHKRPIDTKSNPGLF